MDCRFHFGLLERGLEVFLWYKYLKKDFNYSVPVDGGSYHA